MKEYYVYILECCDGSYYTGITNDHEKLMGEHQSGIDPQCYTYKRRPVKLAYLEKYSEIWDAIRREKQLKTWGRKKKEALFMENFKTLQSLAKKKFR